MKNYGIDLIVKCQRSSTSMNAFFKQQNVSSNGFNYREKVNNGAKLQENYTMNSFVDNYFIN